MINEGFFFPVLNHLANKYPPIVHSKIDVFKPKPNKKNDFSKIGTGCPCGKVIKMHMDVIVIIIIPTM